MFEETSTRTHSEAVRVHVSRPCQTPLTGLPCTLHTTRTAPYCTYLTDRDNLATERKSKHSDPEPEINLNLLPDETTVARAAPAPTVRPMDRYTLTHNDGLTPLLLHWADVVFSRCRIHSKGPWDPRFQNLWRIRGRGWARWLWKAWQRGVRGRVFWNQVWYE